MVAVSWATRIILSQASGCSDWLYARILADYGLADTQLTGNRGRFLQRGLEFTDIEIGDNKITVNEGGCFALPAELDHLIHEDFVLTDFPCLQFQSD